MKPATRQSIIAALVQGPATQDILVTRSRVTKPTIIRALPYLEREGAITRVPGTWPRQYRIAGASDTGAAQPAPDYPDASLPDYPLRAIISRIELEDWAHRYSVEVQQQLQGYIRAGRPLRDMTREDRETAITNLRHVARITASLSLAYEELLDAPDWAPRMGVGIDT